jgi:dephospho-CoA kinase
MKTVGLTGGIACGKSTVAALLRARGVPVLDADQASRQVTAPGSPALAEIAARFGADLIGPDGALDRKALGARIVGDPEARRALEAITHPRIFAALEAGIAALADQGHPVGVIEAALMVETGSDRRYDALLVVRASPEVQVQRLISREGGAEAQARAWLAAQMPVADKAKLATAVIDNDGDRAALEASTDRAWGVIRSKLGLSTG